LSVDRPTSGRRASRTRPASSARDDLGREASRRRSDRALISLAEAMTAGLSSQQVLDRVVAAAATLTGEAAVHLWLVSEDHQELRLAAQFGTRPGKTGVPPPMTLRIAEGLAGAVAKSREPLVIPSLRAERRVANRAWIRDQGAVSFAGVPFVLADRLLGVLCLFTLRRYHFTRYEVDLLRSFASHAAAALANAALLEEAKQREAEARALFEVGRLINATLDPERVLDLIVEKARELMRVKACGVFRLDQHRVLHYLRGTGLSPAFTLALSVPLAQGTSGRAVAERRPVWSADILEDPNIPLSPAARSSTRDTARCSRFRSRSRTRPSAASRPTGGSGTTPRRERSRRCRRSPRWRRSRSRTPGSTTRRGPTWSAWRA
jgi:GAF domain-containing protein